MIETMLAYKALSTGFNYALKELKTKLVFNEKGSKVEIEAKLFGVQDLKVEVNLAVPEAIRSRMPAPMLERCQKLMPSFFGKSETQEAAQKSSEPARGDTPEQTREKFKRYASREAHDERHRLSADFYAASRLASDARSLPDGVAKEQAAKLGEQVQKARESRQAMLNLRSQYRVGEAGRSLRDLDPQQRQAFREAYVKAFEDNIAVSNMASEYRKEFPAPERDGPPPPGAGMDAKTAQPAAERPADADAQARARGMEPAGQRQWQDAQQQDSRQQDLRQQDSQQQDLRQQNSQQQDPRQHDRQQQDPRQPDPQRHDPQQQAATARSDERSHTEAARHVEAAQGGARQASERQAASRFGSFVPESRKAELARPDAAQRDANASTSEAAPRRSALDAFTAPRRELRDERQHETARQTEPRAGQRMEQQAAPQSASQAASQAAPAATREAGAERRPPSRFAEFVPQARQGEIARSTDAARRDESGAQRPSAEPSLDGRIAERVRELRAGQAVPEAARTQASEASAPRAAADQSAAERSPAPRSNLERLESGTERARERAAQPAQAGEERQERQQREAAQAPSPAAPAPRLTPENQDWYKKAIAEGERDVAASRELLSDERAGQREQAREQHGQALQAARDDFDAPDRQRATSAAGIVQAQSDFQRADDRLGELMQRHGIESSDDVAKLRQSDQHEFARAHLNASQARDRVAELGQQHERQFGQQRAESSAPRQQQEPAGSREAPDGASRPMSRGEQFLHEERERQQRMQEERARQSAQSEESRGRSR